MTGFNTNEGRSQSSAPHKEIIFKKKKQPEIISKHSESIPLGLKYKIFSAFLHNIMHRLRFLWLCDNVWSINKQLPMPFCINMIPIYPNHYN